MKSKNIRNFCMIAHIDHGKSTLSDRMIEFTNTVSQRDMKEQLLDNMDLERERGITIKLQPIRMYYRSENGEEYEFNLIDTPGHADFNYEVSRSLAACEGAILLVDATQGVQAQTLANLKLAQEQNLAILPVINKIDMANADVESVMSELKDLDGIDISQVVLASAKNGTGVKKVLEKIINIIPAPKGSAEKSLQALIFDSHYDPYQGVVLYVRIVNGNIKAGMKVKMLASNDWFEVFQTGVFVPKMYSENILVAGNVGYISTNIKDALKIKVGDTLVDVAEKNPQSLPGYKEVKQMVFAGLFPVDSENELKLKDAVEKLALNDASFQYALENSSALGIGFRCGFLGILHMEIIQERLEREYGIEIISTAPSVAYKLHLKSGENVVVHNPTLFPSSEKIEYIEEPYVHATIIIPANYIGDIMNLCKDKRGVYIDMHYINSKTVEFLFELPMAEIVYDFYDSLKSLTHGYASIDYQEGTYKRYDLVKMDIWLNDDPVDAFSFILPREQSYERGKEIVQKMKYVIPRKLYPMPVQSVVENKVIAREDIPPLRKSATGKGYSGNASKKKKIAKNIKENKIRQKKFGGAEIPQEAFHAILDIR